MDKALLVMNDVQMEGVERRVLKALSEAKIPVTLFDLTYMQRLSEWQLVIATPLYDSKGPHEANSRVVKALQDEGFYESIPIRRLTVTGPKDPLARALEEETKIKREGAVEIFRTDGKRNRYMVLFAPFVGPGGAVPARYFTREEELREFLEHNLFISRSSVDEALSELKRKGETSIGNVHLTRKEVKKLGLA